MYKGKLKFDPTLSRQVAVRTLKSELIHLYKYKLSIKSLSQTTTSLTLRGCIRHVHLITTTRFVKKKVKNDDISTLLPYLNCNVMLPQRFHHTKKLRSLSLSLH